MIAGRRVSVVMPAYNAEKTLRQTTAEIDRTLVDDIIPVSYTHLTLPTILLV